MSEMMERVAKALAAHHFCKTLDRPSSHETVRLNVDEYWHLFKGEAIAVLDAMREFENDSLISRGKIISEKRGL